MPQGARAGVNGGRDSGELGRLCAQRERPQLRAGRKGHRERGHLPQAQAACSAPCGRGVRHGAADARHRGGVPRGAGEGAEGMRADDFVDAVQEMRDLQKAYFSTRDPSLLHRAKFAEQHVDRLLSEYHQEDGRQPELFGRC